jgi:methionyl-tRNA synthetase
MKQEASKVLITSALPYANGPLHFGHIAGAYLPGDCYARFQRLQGKEVLYICGSDEHGVAITLSAEQAGRSPKEHVDLYHQVNQELFHKLHFSFDYYGRTTGPEHARVTQEFFRALQEKGVIEERTENHLYSEKEGRFLADRYVVGTCPKCGYEEARGDECQRCAASFEATDLKHPRSKLTGSPLTLKPSLHLYLRFDAFKEQLAAWIADKPWKANVLQFAKRYIEELKPRAITRDSDWGIPVPGYPGKVFYVWFDAPIGYVSIVQEWAKKQGDFRRWEDYWLDGKASLIHFIGKDNIPFHTVFFPAMLMGQDKPYNLPDQVPANEFFLLEGRQFSKSDNWTIDLDSFFAAFSADQIRYTLAANAPENSDAEFSWKDFQQRCNAELLGKFGNFANRVLVFLQQHLRGQIPPLHTLHEVDRAFLDQIDHLLEEIADAYSGFHLRKASQLLMELAQLGNAYFDAKKPWILAKNPAGRADLETALHACLLCLQALALASSPIIPSTAQKLWEMVGRSSPLASQRWEQVAKLPLPSGALLPPPSLLFRKIEDAEIEAEVRKLGAKTGQSPSTPSPLSLPVKPPISYDQFAPLDLRVALVTEAAPIPKSKKLLRLTVDLGFEQRTVVSGIALSYAPEQLIGKKVVLLANLAPATIMGVESRGMILAASSGTLLELPHLEALPPGSPIS